MKSTHWRPVLRYIRRMAEPSPAGRVSDAALLARFVSRHDEEAFFQLLERHGPMVMGVCRRMLHDIHDAEDVFQATFLVLVRKAWSIANPDHLAQWLYGVACRTALRARSLTAKRRFHEKQSADTAILEMKESEIGYDFRPILDEEIQRLPHRYQAPVVLCYFCGKTKEEAAQLLGLPVGTVSSRLARAREKLRVRLTRRGVTLSASLLAIALTSEALAAPVSATLTNATANAAMAIAAGQLLAAGVVSVKVASLTKGMIKAMFLFKLKIAAIGIVAALVVGSGAGMVCYRTVAAQEQRTEPSIEDRLRDEISRLKKDLDRAEKEIDRLKQDRSFVKVSAAREGILAVIGSEVKDGEKVPDDQLVMAHIGNDKRKYRRLTVGDHVQAGQMLGRIDDRLARDEVAIKQHKLDGAKAELVTSEKTRDEAEARYRTQLDLFRKNATDKEDLRAAELTSIKYKYEVAQKEAAIKVAEAELQMIRTVVELHEIHSPANGIIKAIIKHPGEGVNNFETVFVIQPEEK
jgi:RNA polymerase sigma factor (sigma-70 family)